MIQRIQTVYLLIITILGILTLCLPVFGIHSPGIELNGIYMFDLLAELPLEIGVWVIFLPIVALVIPILSSITIFLFKNRQLQTKLAITSLLFIVLFYILIACFVIMGYFELSLIFPEGSGDYSIDLKTGAFCLVIGMVINILSILAIQRDEKLVRSLDRIR